MDVQWKWTKVLNEVARKNASVPIMMNKSVRSKTSFVLTTKGIKINPGPMATICCDRYSPTYLNEIVLVLPDR